MKETSDSCLMPIIALVILRRRAGWRWKLGLGLIGLYLIHAQFGLGGGG